MLHVSALSFVSPLLFERLSDRIGRKNMHMIGTLVRLVATSMMGCTGEGIFGEYRSR
jgi:MFS family permease